MSNTKVLGILDEMWKTLDQDLKMKYEKTGRLKAKTKSFGREGILD